MDRRKITTLDAIIIAIVAVCIVALVFLVKSYIAIPKSPKNSCWYEIKYLHMSGREITKRVYMTCEGFQHWHESMSKIAMTIQFSDGNSITIQGATDILSVAKIKDNEQQQ